MPRRRHKVSRLVAVVVVAVAVQSRRAVVAGLLPVEQQPLSPPVLLVQKVQLPLPLQAPAVVLLADGRLLAVL